MVLAPAAALFLVWVVWSVTTAVLVLVRVRVLVLVLVLARMATAVQVAALIMLRLDPARRLLPTSPPLWTGVITASTGRVSTEH